MVLITLAPFLPFSLSTPANAQNVRAYVSADTVAVGERFTLSLVAAHRAGRTALFPSADADVFGELMVLGRSEVHRRASGAGSPGMWVDSGAYGVTTFALDTARVPPLRVRFAADSDTIAAIAASLLVPVRSVVPPDAAGLRDFAPPAPFPQPLWPYVLMALLALALLALVGYYLWKRATAAPDAPPARPAPVPAVSPYESARRRLKRLQKMTDLHDPAAIKPFYTELSDVLRQYLAHRLGVATQERTTRELLAALRREIRLPEPVLDHLRAALEQADLAKFADVHPTPPAHRIALEEARAALDAVEDTRRRVPAASGIVDHEKRSPDNARG